MRQRVLGKTPDNKKQLNFWMKRRSSGCTISLMCCVIRHLSDSTCGTLWRTYELKQHTTLKLKHCVVPHLVWTPHHARTFLVEVQSQFFDAFAEVDWASKETECKSSCGATKLPFRNEFDGTRRHLPLKRRSEVASCTLNRQPAA